MENEKLKEIINNLTMLPVLQERAEKLRRRIYTVIPYKPFIRKVLIIGIIILIVLSIHAYGFEADDKQPAIELDSIEIEAAPYIDGVNVYLPLRAIAEALGFKVEWWGKEKTITVSKPGKNIVIDFKNEKITANDHVYYMSEDYTGHAIAEDIIIGNRTYMREDFFSENLGLRVRWDRQSGKVKLESVKENVISIRTMKDVSETDKIKLAIQYPQIDGLDDRAVQDSINSILKKSAMDAKSEGLQNIEYISGGTAGYTGSQNKHEICFNYRLKYNQNGLLSMVFTNYQYTGGAHGMTVQSSYTLNLKTGEEYGIKDLFKDDTDYVLFISNLVKDEINERIKKGILPEYSITPFKAIKDDQDFYMSNNAVIVYFQEYEYFPYAAGIQEFDIDFSVLKGLLKPEFNFLNDSYKLQKSSETLNDTDGNAPFYGSRIVYTSEDGLYCTRMNDGYTFMLVKGNGISTPVFSSDGKAVAFIQDRALYAYVFETSKVQMLLEGVDSFCPWENGGFYASSEKDGIIAVNPQTAESSVIVPAERDTSYIHLKLSPDSRYLAYDSVVSGIDNQDKGGVWLYDTILKNTQMVVKTTKIGDNFLMGMHPSAGKWSTDSSKILIWIMSHSASLSADGVGAAIYDVTGGKLMELDICALAYDENVSFANPTTFAMITGCGREMFKGKNISFFDLGKDLTPQTLEIPGKVPTTPCYSPDGKKLVFAMSPSAKTDDDYKSQIATISKRQIFMCMDDKLLSLTNDDTYRSEAPVFLRNNNYIVFARLNGNGEKSVWIMDSDGKNQKLLARWKYSDPNDDRSTDFYGRIDWSVMFAIFDKTKMENTGKMP